MTNWNYYQEQTKQTANANLSPENAMTSWNLGLMGETSEVIEVFKKVDFHGHTLDGDKVKKELGDVSWYMSQVANEEGLQIVDLASIAIKHHDHSAFVDYLHAGPAKGDHVIWLLFELNKRIALVSSAYQSRLFQDLPVESEVIAFYLYHVLLVWQELVKVIAEERPECTGLTEQGILDANILKLHQKRYKNGFSTDASVNRTE